MQVNPLQTDFNADINLLHSSNKLSNKGLIARVDRLELTVQNLTERIKELLTTIENLQYILDGDERR